jgi:hypothetical protein
MSRAFVNEDSFIEELPDRPVSDQPNLVTERGLEMIETVLETARREYGEAQAAGDREALAKAGRTASSRARRIARGPKRSPTASVITAEVLRSSGFTQLNKAIRPQPVAGKNSSGRPVNLRNTPK